METVRIIIAGFGIGVASTLVNWLFIGKLFHGFQKETPDVWRNESAISHMLSAALSVLWGLFFALLYTKAGSLYVASSLRGAFLFGMLCYATFSFTHILSTAIYIRQHILFTTGKLIASFFAYAIASLIAFFSL